MGEHCPEFCPHGGMVESVEASPATLAGNVEGQSPKRLIWAAVVASVLWSLAALHQVLGGEPDMFLLGTTAGVVLAATGLVFLSRVSSNPKMLLGFGSLYLLLTTVAVAAVEQRAGIGAGIGAGISWNAMWVAFFPLMVPCSPRKTLIKATIAASMTPLVFGFYVVFLGREIPSLAHAFALFLPVYVGAGIAFVSAKFIERVGARMNAMAAVGRYELVRRLGEGGMGEVYEARHRQLARPVALKLIKRGDDDGTKLARFQREARVTASLKSPHTIELFDFGATEDGRIFYAMELLEGMDLERLVQKHGPLPPARVAHIMRQTLDSLEEAHARGLVHRDIKPANLHLGRYGLAYDHLKVLDFGLVKSSGDLTLGANLTGENRISGTPAYMAPESVTGDGTVDGRADIYALGCVALWLLTGQRVFPNVHDVLRAAVAHVTETPATPSERGFIIPEDFESVLMACLEKDPVRRPDAKSLRQMIDACELETWSAVDAEDWWAEYAPLPDWRVSSHPPTPSTDIARPPKIAWGAMS